MESTAMLDMTLGMLETQALLGIDGEAYSVDIQFSQGVTCVAVDMLTSSCESGMPFVVAAAVTGANAVVEDKVAGAMWVKGKCKG